MPLCVQQILTGLLRKSLLSYVLALKTQEAEGRSVCDVASTSRSLVKYMPGTGFPALEE